MNFKERYSAFLLNNLDAVSLLENSLRTLLFFAPGRLHDSELKLEIAYGVAGLFSWIHDWVIIDFIEKQRDRITTGETQLSKLDRIDELIGLPPTCVPFAKWIAFCRALELLVEIYSKQRWGENGKWTSAMIVESFKALLKLFILKKNGGKMILRRFQMLPQYRDQSMLKELFVKMMNTSETSTNISTDQEEFIPKHTSGKPRGKRLGSSMKWKQFRTFQRIIDNKLQEKFKSSGIDSISNEKQRVTMEILFILRPLVYLMGILRFGDNSWISWLLSLLVDITSQSFYLSKLHLLNEDQNIEFSRRNQLLLYYLLRNPLFKEVTIPFLDRGAFRRKNIPIIGSLFGILRDYLMVYQDHYFYTAGT